MKKIVLLAAFLPTISFAQAPAQKVPVDPADLQTVVSGYLYPQKTQPGDVLSAIQRITQAVQEAGASRPGPQAVSPTHK